MDPVVVAPEDVAGRVHRRAQRIVGDGVNPVPGGKIETHLTSRHSALRPNQGTAGSVAIRPNRCRNPARVGLNRGNCRIDFQSGVSRPAGLTQKSGGPFLSGPPR